MGGETLPATFSTFVNTKSIFQPGCSSLVAPETPILKMKRLLYKQLCCDNFLLKNPLFTWAVIGMLFIFALGMREGDVKRTEL